jgi:hypothetical protein
MRFSHENCLPVRIHCLASFINTLPVHNNFPQGSYMLTCVHYLFVDTEFCPLLLFNKARQYFAGIPKFSARIYKVNRYSLLVCWHNILLTITLQYFAGTPQISSRIQSANRYTLFVCRYNLLFTSTRQYLARTPKLSDRIQTVNRYTLLV